MKTKQMYVMLCSALLVLGLYACDKEDVDPYARDYEYGGEATALKDNEPWTAEIRATQAIEREFGFSIQFMVYDQYLLIEDLYLYKIPGEIGKHSIINSSAREPIKHTGGKLFVMIDGDVIDDVYLIDETKDNYITIDEYNPRTATIRGTFQVHTIIERDGHLTESEPDIHFTSGEYETEVNPEWFE